MMSEEAAFQGVDAFSERSGELLKPDYQLKPSDGRKLNYAITKQKEAFEKLNGLLKNLKDHDSTLFQANGITLKHGEKFHHDFNVKHIASVEAKQLKVSREIETLEEKKKTFERTFKGLQGNYVSKERKLKENRRKSNNRKRKRVENNIRHVYHICVANPLDKELSNCLLYPRSLTIPQACINVEAVATMLFRQDAKLIAYLLQANYFSNAAVSRMLTNLEPEVRNRVYCILHPEDYHTDDTSEEEDDDEEEDENDEEEEENIEEEEENVEEEEEGDTLFQ